MKKLILFLIILFAIPVYSQVTLSSRDSIQTLVSTDIFLAQTNASGFKNRQISFRLLANNMFEFISGASFGDFNSGPMTWSKTPVFSRGATFSASGDGAVTFADTVTVTGPLNLGYTYNLPTADATVSLGGNVGLTPYWFSWVWTHNIGTDALWLYNDELNDSASITFDDSLMTVDRAVSFLQPTTFAQGVSFDSSYSFENTSYGVYTYVVGNVGDSILTLQDTCAVVSLSLPGDVTNMEKIIFAPWQGRDVGTVIRIINTKQTSTIFWEDDAASDGNLFLAGDFTMGIYDYLELMYVYKGAYYWMETGRSNN